MSGAGFRFFAAIVLVAGVANSVIATEWRLPIPPGFAVDTGYGARFVAGAHHAAIAALPNSTSHGEPASIVLQADASSVVTTTVPGLVRTLEYSPDENHLLVVATTSTNPPAFSITLLDARGHVLWRKEDSIPHWFFTTTGEAVARFPFQAIDAYEVGSTLQVFDPGGTRILSRDLGRRCSSLVVVGRGPAAIIVGADSVARLSTSDGVRTEWVADLKPHQFTWANGYRMGSSHVLVEGFGPQGKKYLVYDLNGQASATVDRKTWPGMSPNVADSILTGLQAFPDHVRDKAYLFGGTWNGLVIDGRVGAAREIRYPLNPVSGYRRATTLGGSGILFYGLSDAMIRSVE